MNNRLLTYVYDDERGISHPLTPAALIYGRTVATTPNDKQFEIISTSQALTRRDKYHQRLLNQFTNQWRTEYVLNLRESSRVSRGSNMSVIGFRDIVTLK